MHPRSAARALLAGLALAAAPAAALTSIGVATVGTAMMWLWRN